MSNWFENHPTRSIVIYTLVIAGAMWAAFNFVFDENKVAVYRAQVENEKATANQYRAKTEVLEIEIARLRDENRKYLEWMVNTPNTLPYLEQRIKQLTDENSRTKGDLAGTSHSESSGTATLSVMPYSTTKTLSIGEAMVDSRTNATFGIGRITSDFTASAVLTLPGDKPQELSQVKAGSTWSFVKDGKHYQLVVSKVDWFSNKAEVVLKEIDASPKKPDSAAQGMLQDKAAQRR